MFDTTNTTDPVVVLMHDADTLLAADEMSSAFDIFTQISQTMPATINGALDELRLALDEIDQITEPENAIVAGIASGCIRRVIAFLQKAN